MPVFSGLLSSSSRRGSNTDTVQGPSASLSRRATSSSDDFYVFDESELAPVEPETPDVRELNNSLEALATCFPDVQVDVFREMLSSFDDESRLAVVADALLKNKVSWVKGRWRSMEPPDAKGMEEKDDDDNEDAWKEDGCPSGAFEGDCTRPHVPTSEVFRSTEYRDAVQDLARAEFKGLSRSSINAVLAEQNYNYLRARQTLVDVSSKSWRFAFSTILFRRKPVVNASANGQEHPLVVWRKSNSQGIALPCIKGTGCAELDYELYTHLVKPLRMMARKKQESSDRETAVQLNKEEADAENAMLDCECCFTDSTFEEVTSCSSHGHIICFLCVQRTLKESVFGQGWHGAVDEEKGVLKCPAMEADGCDGHISSSHLRRAMLQVKKGTEILRKFEDRLANHNLAAAGLDLVHCLFCNNAEVDDPSGTTLQLRKYRNPDYIPATLWAIVAILVSSTISFIAAAIQFFLDLLPIQRKHIQREFEAAQARYCRRMRGPKFVCQNKRCGRASCMVCHKAWIDVHVCYESSLIALRTQVEQAMSMAIKRVCPKCSTAFVKTEGCNKLTCPCGYKMCYVCRQDIGAKTGPHAGYQHFCSHFNPLGNGRPCSQCTRCNLYENEDTEKILSRAKEEAEKKWREENNARQLSHAERAFVESGVVNTTARGRLWYNLTMGRLPTMADLCDVYVELVYETAC